ncbi:MAG: hypothetical protein QM800_04485 [Paludibacter sp.]
MQFEQGHLYHVYNQGNNRQRIFFSRENYLFFLTKIRTCILPHADIIAWCLMPNHFHLMIYVHSVEVVQFISGSATLSRTPTKSSTQPTVSLNKSIGIMLASYTRAINIQQNSTGSLFREKTKAECLTLFNGLTPSYFNTAFGAQINVRITEREYPQACFNYIHQNPVTAKLVKKPEDWEFSSYTDYFGDRNGKLVNRDRAGEFFVFTG